MTSHQTSADSADVIFHEAMQRPAGRERSQYLDAACGGDPAKRRHVERLVQAYAEADSFLESPASDSLSTADDVHIERAGDTIGPYTLIEPIGEGGFGVVFLAEQTQPVRRRVALKVIKPGMDTREVIARFEAERQALALMDHPHIAKVFEAGSTESGRPYFVMELVAGVPITEYADQCRLTTRERLGLFVLVCQAVQHAHQKGVIHRDLKPTNILVALQDGRPVPKIIDFGVAKAMNQRLTERTLASGFFPMIGTPMYMSPEQAELSPLGVDTRSDIYALGVLLYELLTGTTPFDKHRIGEASYDELRRIIREEEPPRPSSRISTLAADLATTVAEGRRTEPRRHVQSVRGELDWIVMKCLEKDRSRRYETATSLAQDVERYLADEPIEACPPSAAYRARKLVRRNKGPVLAASLVLLVLVGGIVGTTWGLLRAVAERDQKETARLMAESNRRQATQVVYDLLTSVSESALADDPALEPLRNKILQRALDYLENFVQQAPDDPELQAELVAAHMRIAYLVYMLDAEQDWLMPSATAFDIMEDLMKTNPELEALVSLQDGIGQPAGASAYLRSPDEALRVFDKGRVLWQRLVDEHPSIAGFQVDLATFLSVISYAHKLEGRPAQALESMRECCGILRKLTTGHSTATQAKASLSMALVAVARAEALLGNLASAKEAARESVELADDLVAAHSGHPTFREIRAWVQWGPAEVYEHAGEFDKAAEAWRRRRVYFQELASEFPAVRRYRRERFWSQQLRGEALWAAERREEAVAAFEQAQKLANEIHPDDTLGQALRAWFLAACPERQFRSPDQAVEIAEKLVVRNSVIGDYWLCLGAAEYADGNWKAAIDALKKGKGLPHEPLIAARFVLPMAYCRVGDRAAAQTAFDEADDWIKNRHLQYVEVRRLRREARDLLEQPPMDQTQAPTTPETQLITTRNHTSTDNTDH